jgi:hypothetical protein
MNKEALEKALREEEDGDTAEQIHTPTKQVYNLDIDNPAQYGDAYPHEVVPDRSGTEKHSLFLSGLLH